MATARFRSCLLGAACALGGVAIVELLHAAGMRPLVPIGWPGAGAVIGGLLWGLPAAVGAVAIAALYTALQFAVQHRFPLFFENPVTALAFLAGLGALVAIGVWMRLKFDRLLRAERELQESEARSRALLDGIPDRVWLKDAEGRYLAINRSEAQAHGIPEEQILGKHVAEFRPAAEARGVDEEDHAAMEASGPLRIERKSNLGDSWREIIKAPIRTEHGEVLGLVGISRDITERKQAEFLLKEATERLQRALDGSNLSLWDTDLTTGEVFLSGGWAELRGAPPGDTRISVDELMRLVHPADLERIVQLSKEVIRGKREGYDDEHRVRTLAGEWIWIRSTGKVAGRDADGRALRMSGTNRDITPRKLAENVLRESESRFRSLTSLSSDWYWEQDENFRFTFMSGQLYEKTGIDEQSHIGRTHWDMPASNLTEEDWNRHKEVLERHEPFVDFVMRRPDAGGRRHWVSISGEPIFDELKGFRGYRGIGRDVTAEHIARERIERANVELETRVRERTSQLEALLKELETFTYTVAHDLRTPLGVMSTYAGMVQHEFGAAIPEQGRAMLGRISENAVMMARLLDDLLEFARLGQVSISRISVSMNSVAADALSELRKLEPGRQVEVKIGTMPNCQGDGTLLRQLWSNLLSNAYRYSRQRNPAVVEVGYDAARSAYFVRDNGIGFDMKHAGKLFSVFERLHRDEEITGTGMGLALAARIVQRHGGRIWAESQPDEGATFWFVLGGDLHQ